jgi:hypothetical protein
VIEVGTVSEISLLDSVTMDPPAGAGWVRVTVHVVVAPSPNVPGEHATGEGRGTMTVPPPADAIVRLFPIGSTPVRLDNWIDALVLPDAIVAVTYATTPDPIVVLFNPVTMHVSVLGPAAQAGVFMAAEVAGPGVNVIAEICSGK